MTMADHSKLSDSSAAFDMDALTAKQRDVLDLLIQFKTSKEISRILEISPHTVDQRIDAAKAKLGASSRSELALTYRRLVGEIVPLYERLTYKESPVDPSVSPDQTLERDEEIATSTAPGFGNGDEASPALEERDYSVVPELFDGRWGTLARLGAIVGIAILLCIVFLGGLAILVQMSNLLGR